MAKEIKAQAKNVKGSPQKARIVANAVRGKKATDAMITLQYMRKGAALKVRKVLKSAIANAVNNESMNAEKLVISKILIDEAPTYKRFTFKGRGRVHGIIKRNSHITVYVSDQVKAEKEVATKKEAPIKKTNKKIVSKKAGEKEVVKKRMTKAKSTKSTKKSK